MGFDRRPALASGFQAKGDPRVVNSLVAVDKADRFWPDVTRLVVAILIVVLILAAIGMYISSMTFMESSG